jgi:hypothetical protein
VAVASALIWVWARLRWIVVVALVSGLLMGTWVVVGAWDPPDDPSLAQQLLELLDSLWFPAAVLVLSFTSVALRLAPEDRP